MFTLTRQQYNGVTTSKHASKQGMCRRPTGGLGQTARVSSPVGQQAHHCGAEEEERVRQQLLPGRRVAHALAEEVDRDQIDLACNQMHVLHMMAIQPEGYCSCQQAPLCAPVSLECNSGQLTQRW